MSDPVVLAAIITTVGSVVVAIITSRNKALKVTADDPIDAETLRQMRDGLLRNIRSLAADVELLYGASRFSRTVALSLLCGEEFAKLLTVDACLTVKNLGHSVGWTPIWKEMQRHETKLWIFVGVVSKTYITNPPKTWSEFIGAMERNRDGSEAAQLNRLKQDAIYVGLRKGAVSVPDDSISEAQAAASQKAVKALVMLLESVEWE